MPVSPTRSDSSATERSERFFARTRRFLRRVAAWDSERFCDALQKWVL